MHIRRASEEFSYEVNISGKEVVGVTITENSAKGYIIASNSQAIELEFRCFQVSSAAAAPDILLELYIDGVLRNVAKPRTGRGMPDGQLAEAKVDRGLILTKDGFPIMKNLRFVDLDLDDAIISSRLVENAGDIKVKVINAGSEYDPFDDDASFELPNTANDRGCITLLEGEINNTVGIRFDEGDNSIHDTKHITLHQSISAMTMRQNSPFGKVLAEFTFIYGCDDLLNHLGAIPLDHKLYNHQIACQRFAFQQRAVGQSQDQSQEKRQESFAFQSDYTLLRMGMDDRYSPSPYTPPIPSVAVVIENSGYEQMAQDLVDNMPVTPKKRRVSTARSQRSGKQPSTPRKSPIRPGMVRQRLGLFTPTTVRRRSASRPLTPSPCKKNVIEDIGLNTPSSPMRTSPHSPPSSPMVRVLSSKSPAGRRLIAASLNAKMSKAMTDDDPFGGFLGNLSLERGRFG